MEILAEHEVILSDKRELFITEYARRELVLSSPQALATLGPDEPVVQLSIQVKSKSLRDLINELPHATAVTHQICLFPKRAEHILPTAVLIKSIENTYPFTLQWQFSGGDQPFVQPPKSRRVSWLTPFFGYSFGGRSSGGGGSTQKKIADRFWNVTTKFGTMNADRCNRVELLGFHGADFRSTTACIKESETHSYYHIRRSYKYFHALQHAFVHVHYKCPELTLLLQQSPTLWKASVPHMNEVLDWIEKECVTDPSSCLLPTDQFQVCVQKYDGEGWHVLSESSSPDTPQDQELCAEIQLLLVHKPASAEFGVRNMVRKEQ